MKLETIIRKMTKNVRHGPKHYREHNLLHPSREWCLGLLGAFVIGLGGAWWAFITYLHYQTVSSQQTEVTTTVTNLYNADTIRAALQVLEERAHRAEAVKNALRGVPPSDIYPLTQPNPPPKLSTTTVTTTPPATPLRGADTTNENSTATDTPQLVL
jgi:hypothetical protein